MFLSIFSLVLPFFISTTAALGLDVNNQDSVKSTAKTLASAIVADYSNYLQDAGIPGLFSESGDPYYWWEAGAVWNGLLEYSYLTGDSQFNDLVSKAVLWQVGDYDAFMPVNQTETLGNSDQSTWGLTAMTAAEIELPMPQSQGGAWVDLAVNVFNTQVARWDEKSCAGGLKWQIFTFNNGYNYKNSPSAAGFFLLAARLAKFTGNQTYSDWAEKQFQWMQDVGLMSKDFHIFDGTDDRTNCSQVNHIQWTMNHAMFTEGAALMYNVTKGGDQWKDAVMSFVNGSSVFQNNSVLTEVACEKNDKCDIDQKSFKGIAARSFARAAVAAPFVSDSVTKMLQASAKAAATNCDGDEKNMKCALKWTGNGSDAVSIEDEGLGEAYNAMAVVQALLWPEAKAVGMGNSTSPSASGSVSPSGTAGAAAPQNTNAAGMQVASLSAAIMMAVFAMLLL